MSSPEKATPAKKKRSKPENPPEIEIKLSWCKSCGLCVEYCNTGALEMDGIYPKVVAAEKCTYCLQCEMMCPDFAIKVEEGPGGDDPGSKGTEA